jgi:dihydrodipicolinate synthase/N-acetylneuraminate lyase
VTHRPFGATHPLLIVAAATPLTDGGAELDEAAVWPYIRFLTDGGADGVFACGTTGEGVLLRLEERKRAAVVFRAALRGTLIVHAGAQNTADTAELAAHAAEMGADGVAVIPPPYFPLDEAALTAHLVAAARACEPLPFFIYCFAARSGYPVSLAVIERVREAATNLAGLKVSESPWANVEPYLSVGLPVFVGQEPLIPRALAAGAVGAVSGLAAAFPEAIRAVLDAPDAAGEARLEALRRAMESSGGSFIAAIKHMIGVRGVPVSPALRPPMRSLTPDEAARLDSAVASEIPTAAT